MRIEPGRFDLTYCTNIHAGESWDEVEASLAEYAVPLKQRLSPDARFAIGLRLSAVAASQLLEGNRLARFHSWLDEHKLYVAIVNGFPFGSFHAQIVKADVFAPDWRDPARLRYTLDLVRILSRLLPEEMDGSISTLPLSYKPWIEKPNDAWPIIIAHLTEITAELINIRKQSGRFIHVDIEPEPNGLLETTAEVIEFFNGPLMELGAPMLAECLSCTIQAAGEQLREHIQVCFDSCHMAIQFEDAAESLGLLKTHDIRIGRLQISSALRIALDGSPDRLRAALAPFAEEGIYLHQVIEQNAQGTLRRYADLHEALASDVSAAGEWRIHFHLPLFTAQHGAALSTQAENRELLALAAREAICSHLEIETYTWHVLPASLKTDLLSSIEREFRWVMRELSHADDLCIKL